MLFRDYVMRWASDITPTVASLLTCGDGPDTCTVARTIRGPDRSRAFNTRNEPNIAAKAAIHTARRMDPLRMAPSSNSLKVMPFCGIT